VELFPASDEQGASAVASLLVRDLRQEGVDFFVAQPPQPSTLVPFARAFVLTLIVIALIDVCGFMPEFIWGCIIVGSAWLGAARSLDEYLCETASDLRQAAAAGQARHDASVGALLGRRRRRDEAEEAASSAPPPSRAPLLYRLEGVERERRSDPIPVRVEVDPEAWAEEEEEHFDI